MGGAVQLAVDLNAPGTYLHWNIFTVSEANLVLILVMLVIFGVALLVPFPVGKHARDAGPQDQGNGAPEGTPTLAAYKGDAAGGGADGGGADGGATDGGGDPTMWTARVRRLGLRFLPPGKLLPDRQPAYVRSWVYVFGVATLSALGVAIVSGFALALGGPDWWHYNPVGHFFNSLHMWSVEMFMAFMVIHLWGKFWMAAWRGRRALTWMTGVVAFVASVVECFTGYLSQQNLDSQWISTNAKDAVNAAGVGPFFDTMNFGQMLMWHIVLVPLVLVAIVGAHILLVRVRGVSHPLPEQRVRGRAARRAATAADAAEWRGPTRRYDILKEASIAGAVVLVLVIVLASVVSSPDVPPVTVQSWSHATPGDFMATSAAELAYTSETATYGPPYDNTSTPAGSGMVQKIIVSWQLITGVMQPINSAKTFVLSPLSTRAPGDPTLTSALHRYETAPKSVQKAWDTAYLKVVHRVTFRNDVPYVPRAADGPVPVLISAELTMARSGALDAALLAHHQFYGTNYTKPLLFLEDGSYFASVGRKLHVLGTEWGVMNETGSYPGQPWLWLYTLWYQVPGFRTSTNVDLIAIYLTGVATILLLAVPVIPGLRDIPRYLPVHRLVWRAWNREAGGHGGDGGSHPAAGPSGSGASAGALSSATRDAPG
ncbi:MAG: cytochrome b N-terminal domain-containing protein [Actinomycetota bacterium]|nr:cytochrome b N-terminal domain-containing protein [Actinomycetota bacterium]